MKPLESIADLTPDPENAREHTPRGEDVLVEIMGRVGAGRSIVVDEDGVILAGNATVAAAKRIGLSAIEVIDAEPDTLVAVRRSGLSPDDKTALALADNRAAELSFWNQGRLGAHAANGVPVREFFDAADWRQSLNLPPSVEMPPATHAKPASKEIQPDALNFETVEIPLPPGSAFKLKAELDAWIAEHGTADGFGRVIVRRIVERARG